MVAAEILKLLEIRPEERLGILQLVNEINAPGTKTSRELVEAHREEHEDENLNSIGVRVKTSKQQVWLTEQRPLWVLHIPPTLNRSFRYEK
jgi:hypothetical protein